MLKSKSDHQIHQFLHLYQIYDCTTLIVLICSPQSLSTSSLEKESHISWSERSRTRFMSLKILTTNIKKVKLYRLV